MIYRSAVKIIMNICSATKHCNINYHKEILQKIKFIIQKLIILANFAWLWYMCVYTTKFKLENTITSALKSNKKYQIYQHFGELVINFFFFLNFHFPCLVNVKCVILRNNKSGRSTETDKYVVNIPFVHNAIFLSIFLRTFSNPGGLSKSREYICQSFYTSVSPILCLWNTPLNTNSPIPISLQYVYKI